MNLEDLADEAKKENIISIVSKMSKVDGRLHENEFIYLLKLGLSFGMDDEKVREIILFDEDFIFVPISESERVEILYYLIFLIKVDGVITKEEEDLMHHFGMKLGFNPLLIDNILRIAKSSIGKDLAPNALLEEVKKYLN